MSDAVIRKSVDPALNKKLNSLKADILGGKNMRDTQELTRENYSPNIGGKILLSYYSARLDSPYNNFSVIYILNNIRCRVQKINGVLCCQDLVFIDIIIGSVQDGKHAKANSSTFNSMTEPFYHV